jgi:hypothetical protein
MLLQGSTLGIKYDIGIRATSGLTIRDKRRYRYTYYLKVKVRD